MGTNNPRHRAARQGHHILIAIASARPQARRREAIRDTWLAHALPNMETVFFVDREEGKETRPEQDTVDLDFPDDDPLHPARLLAICRHALEHFAFDGLVLCDDATYVAVDRLPPLLSCDQDPLRLPGGGTASLFSRRRLERTLALGKPTADFEPFLCRTGAGFPLPGNTLVTAQCPLPEEMRAVHTLAREEPEGKIRLDHPDCRGEVHFYGDGTFARHPEPEYGLWAIDQEANLSLRFFGARGRVALPVGPLFQDESGPRLKIGLLVIATGRYRSLIHALFESIRKYFLPRHERTLFLLTDADQVPAPDVQVLKVAHRAWPGVTLMRYAFFRDHAAAFAEMDYLFYLDADLRVVDHVGDEILGEGLTAVLHPGFYEVRAADLPYERNPESTAGIPAGEGERYFYGAIQGGKRERYLAAAVEMAARIESDLAKDLVAVWHDESHWNHYLLDFPPGKTLSPSYSYPQGQKLPFLPKVAALEKDHERFRDVTGGWPEIFVAMLCGGLGNQMFQYAHGLALARSFGAALELRFEPGSDRAFALGAFGIALSPDAPEPEAVVEFQGGYLPDTVERLRTEILQGNRTRVLLKGSFQNEKLFAGVAEELRARFRIEGRLPAPCDGRTPVCLQIRRGDYLGDSKFDLCDEPYFRDGMRILRAFIKNPHFYVASDDLEWCRSIFADDPDVMVPERQSEKEGLKLMMACEACVISNSTYGWWGAWLSNCPLVVAPDPWLGDQHWDCLPSRWVQIPADGINCYPKRSLLRSST